MKACLFLAAALPIVSSSSSYVADLCKGHDCTDQPNHPILDYSDEEGCHCRVHPCWDDDGEVHTCEAGSETPNLAFSYEENGVLNCYCSSKPQYGSVYLAQTLCPGETCEASPDHPVLDYDIEKGSCVCSANQCALEDQSCTDPAYPILLYTQDIEGNSKCTCQQRFEKPGLAEEL